MHVSVETTQLRKLKNDLDSVGRSMDRKTLGPALVDAAKPFLIASAQEAPVGQIPRYKSSVVTRGPRKGNPRRNSGSQARGGATRRDVRLKQVDGIGEEVVRVLDGVNKRSGRVGWRTHFIKRDFLRAAYNRTIDVVKSRFMTSLTKTVNNILARARK